VRAGLDLASWDLHAQQRGLPLAEALSDGSSAQVEANALVTSLDRDLLAEQLDQGYTVFKLKVGSSSLDEDVARVDVLRQALGGRAAIRLDANGAWRDPSEARSALLRIGVEGVESVEQPLPPGSEELWEKVRPGLPLLAADESARNEAACARLLGEGLVHAVVLKPARMGGLGPCLRTARLARASGASLWVTTMLEAAVGRAGCLHLAAALGAQSVRPHGLLTGSLLAEDLGTPFWTEGPLLGIDPGVPGLGVDL